MRGLQEIPPPVSRNHIKIRYTLRGALCALSMTRDWYLCTMVQGAWAQASWDEVYAMTGSGYNDWTAINYYEGSTTGKTLGVAGATTYYYVTTSISFTNSTAGGSGLTILGTVYFYVPYGVTVTCEGANASGQTGAGAGIELKAGNTLILLGQGAVNATGGNAANGCDGANGSDASCDWESVLYTTYWVGGNGHGGNGGGGRCWPNC